MKVTKSFIRLWVSQMLENQSFLNDKRLNNAIVGGASSADLDALKNFLMIYADHANSSAEADYFNKDYKSSIVDVIKMILDGDFIVE